MTTSTAGKNARNDDAGIADYLRDHPDFFLENEDLLIQLRLPHSSGVAVSLIERQVEVLRDRNHASEARLAELVKIARANESLGVKIHRFTRRLMRAPTRREVLAQIERGFREDFDAAEVVLLLFEAGAASGKERHVRQVAADDPNLAGFETLMTSARPRCGQVRDSQREFLFGVEAGSVGSVALVPLIADVPLGLLALGSHDRERFHPGMSTDFLAQLGELISDALARD